MRQIFIFLFALLIFTSCEDDDSLKTAPEIPSVETMVIDFGKLSDATKSAAFEKTNWLYSAATVGVWNVIIGTTFAVPVTAFYHATSQQPVLIKDLTWQWEYPFDAFAGQFKARLVGTLESANKIKWEMHISKTGIDPFDEFLWFEGTSNANGQDGQWIFYHSHKSPVKTVQIDWKKEKEKVGEIKYTYVREKNEQRLPDPFMGSSLTYGLQEGELDAYVIVSAKGSGNKPMTETHIEWSRTDYTGRVKAADFFNDSNWHCWDKDGNNVVCN